MFFFYFENVVAPGRDQDEKGFMLLAFLDGVAFEFFLEKVTVDGTIIEPGTDFMRK